MTSLFEKLDKLTNRSETPVIRMRGLRRSSRYLTLFFPKSSNSALRTIPLSRLTESSFSIAKAEGEDHKWCLMVNNVTIVSDLETEKDARDVLSQIAYEIAPSRWRLVRRVAFVVFLFWFLSPSAQKAPAMALAPSLPISQAQMAPSTDPSPAILTAPAQVEDAPIADSNDAFGLRLVPPIEK